MTDFAPAALRLLARALLGGLLSLSALANAEPPPAATVAPLAEQDKRPELSLLPARTIEFSTSTATWLALDVSPDGQQLVLEILGDLYLLPITGGVATALTQGMAMDSQPRFSPDGEQIVFVSDRSGHDNLWLVDRNGRNLRRLTKGGSRLDFASPSWAPDGSHVVASRSSWGLRTYELWAYHVDGGSGVRLAKSKAAKTTPAEQRANHLGAVYSPDGRYLYYARKNGGFGYNLRFPQWQIARRDLRDDSETLLTAAPGSAFRPQLSPDGQHLVYATRVDQQTALRLRDLNTGADRLLVTGVEGDEQESRFTRDLFPNYAFSPDGQSLFFSAAGQPQQLELASGVQRAIPFTAQVRQDLGPLNRFPQALGSGPVKARVLLQPQRSPDGASLVFSAFMRVYRFDLSSARSTALTPADQQAFYPTFSPDGRRLLYATWSDQGGHIYSMSAKGGRPRQLTQERAHYTQLRVTPDGERVVAIRASTFERLQRESDFGAPVGAELVSLPVGGGATTVIMPADGLSNPHFTDDSERIYLNKGTGDFALGADGGLVSVRFDGSDRRAELSVLAPGIYYAEEDVQVGSITLAPNGRNALVQHANQLYLTVRLNPWLGKQKLKLTSAALPAVRLTSVGADSVGFSADGTSVWWLTGHTLHERALADIAFPEAFPDKAAKDGEGDAAQSEAFEDFVALEEHASVRRWPINVYLPRAEPDGMLALVGATVIPMTTHGDAPNLIKDAVVLLEGSRIKAVGPRASVAIPAGATRMDVRGQWILPGFVDTHAHFRPLRGALGRANPSLQANLAYGVTTGLDVQPSTLDILAYEEAVAAGLMLGPRTLSTGPGIFNNNQFDTLQSAYHVLRRYRDHYGVRNLKAYISGDRRQRQWLVRAAQQLKLMPTTEGSLDMKLNLTHVIDGFSGNEHNFPLQTLYDDVVTLVARSRLGYTPTLLVLYGGPAAEEYFYSRESPADNAKLRRFTPKPQLDLRTQRRNIWVSDAEQRFTQVARQAHKIAQAGGLVGVGSHGQLQGLGYHWELWALASGGFTPFQALRAATIDGARIIGVDQDVGSIAPGKLADLTVLAANPLEDLRATTALNRVVKGGVVYDAQTLDEQWPQQRPLPLQWWQNAAENESNKQANGQ